MKNHSLLFTTLASIFSFSCFAQLSERLPVNATKEYPRLFTGSELTVVSYQVEERINMPFGGSITTYEVSSLNLINTNDLGPNNTRVVTPKYAKAKVVAVAAEANLQPKVFVGTLTANVNPIIVDVVAPAVSNNSIRIDVLATYERVLDKGYKSIDMLQRVGNSRYFLGDLVMAAKWYTQLFELTTDLEAVYYFRYAKSLLAVSQLEKADKMMKIYEDRICAN